MKKILIMGASSGIGRRVAEELASRGIMVGAAARNEKALAELKEKYPDTVVTEQIDITSFDAPERMQELIGKMGGMDIYFHVSGIGYENPDLDPALEAEVINTNAGGFARMMSNAYNYFKQNGGKGHLVGLTSVAGTNGIGDMAAYSASKRCAAQYMVGLEQRANDEDLDLKFTDIRPGWVRTPLLNDGKEYPMEMTLEECVPLVIRAIVKAPRVAVINWKFNLLVGLWRLIPTGLWVKMKVEQGI
ncbi:MAG: SDR family NAD(P)-dependent oxidoreductase [Bacteroidales bacterium]|nr:SDR family NAD(P)-dependent oxidoreductase [Bacteroidales bacterium]